MDPGEKAGVVFRWLSIVTILAYLYLSRAAVRRSGARRSLLTYIMRGNWMHDVNLFAVCAVAVSVTIAFVFLSLSGSLVRQLCAVLDRKVETILRLGYNLIQYLTVFVLLYQIFNYLGFPTSTVLASVGLASLAITLGAQGLVADILSGIFNVFEGGYHVGDYIQAGDFEGTVREIGVRTTMIQSRMQDVKIIENSKIGDVINKTKLNSFVSISLKIPSTESLERIEAILAAELPKIGSGMDKIISGPIYYGVSDVSTSSQPPRESVMTLAISAECLQKDYFEVKKYVYREVLLLCQREHIPLT